MLRPWGFSSLWLGMTSMVLLQSSPGFRVLGFGFRDSMVLLQSGLVNPPPRNGYHKGLL